MATSSRLERTIQAAIAAMEAHTKIAGIDTDDGRNGHSNSIAMYHLLHSLMDVAENEGFSFVDTVQQVLADREM